MATERTGWTNRPVLVTGCTGLLGGWLTGALVAAGAAVVGLVRDGVPHSRLFSSGLDQRIVLVGGALEDYALLVRTLNEYEIDTVFHLGAQTTVGVANRQPLSTFEANIRGTWQLLEACRQTATIQCVLIASSDKAYGSQTRLPYSESLPLQGRHPYDVSKSCADLIAQSYSATYGLPVGITRCGNLYGGGDLNFTRLVPSTIRAALRGERPLIRSDGAPTRDYLYVEDAVEGYLRLAEHLRVDPELGGQAFNLAPEQPRSVLEMVRAILERVGGEPVEPIVVGEATNEIVHQYLDAGRARQTLGWRAHFSLTEGLDRTIAWYREFLGRPAVAALAPGRS